MTEEIIIPAAPGFYLVELDKQTRIIRAKLAVLYWKMFRKDTSIGTASTVWTSENLVQRSAGDVFLGLMQPDGSVLGFDEISENFAASFYSDIEEWKAGT